MFSAEEQLADAVGNDSKRLVEIYNSLPGVTPVKKFANRKVATERIWKAIQGLGQAVDAASPVQPKAFGSRVAAVEAAAVPETPFDEPKPDPAVTEHPTPIDVAPTQAPEQPASEPAAAAEQVPPVSAQTPEVARFHRLRNITVPQSTTAADKPGVRRQAIIEIIEQRTDRADVEDAQAPPIFFQHLRQHGKHGSFRLAACRRCEQ